MIIYFDPAGNQVEFWAARRFKLDNYIKDTYRSQTIEASIHLKQMVIHEQTAELTTDSDDAPEFDSASVKPVYRFVGRVIGEAVQQEELEDEDYAKLVLQYQAYLIRKTDCYYDDNARFVEIGNLEKPDTLLLPTDLAEAQVLSTEHVNFGTW